MRPARACHRPTARPSDPHCRYSRRPLATTGTKPRGGTCHVRVPPTILPLSGLAWTSCDASEHRRCAALRKSRQTDARLAEVRLTNRRCSGVFASASGFRDDELPEPRDEPLTGPAATLAIEPMIGLSKLATIECAMCSALLDGSRCNAPKSCCFSGTIRVRHWEDEPMGRQHRHEKRLLRLGASRRSGIGFATSADYWSLTIVPSTSKPKRSTPIWTVAGVVAVLGAALTVALQHGIPAW
jgi:hypothetical protein